MKWIGSWFGDQNDDRSNWTWDDGSRRLSLRSRGEVDVTDDDADINVLSDGGYLILEERVGSERARVEIRRSMSGEVQRTFYKNGLAAAYEPEGRAWLARRVPDLVRRAGFAAEARVKRIVARKGAGAVLSEVSQIPSSYVKRRYLQTLIELGAVDGSMLSKLLTQAGQEITSDFERATILVQVAKRQMLTTDEQRLAYAVATRTIKSSFEHRRALQPLVESGPLSEIVLKTVMDSASQIESDFELATLLVALGKSQTLSPGIADVYVATTLTIDSDFELRRALTPIVTRGGAPSPVALSSVFKATSGIDSDFELASLLLALLKQQRLDDTTRAGFFAAVDTLQSDFERGRVLKAFVAQGPLTDTLALAVLQSTHRMRSAFEAGGVLKQVAAAHPLTDPVRQAYIDAAERLSSDFERDRALVTLVRSESRNR
jgi:hypothetical protein